MSRFAKGEKWAAAQRHDMREYLGAAERFEYAASKNIPPNAAMLHRADYYRNLAANIKQELIEAGFQP